MSAVTIDRLIRTVYTDVRYCYCLCIGYNLLFKALIRNLCHSTLRDWPSVHCVG